MNELAFLDATALADLVRRGEVTPTELLEDTITRIEALNPRLNAVITPMYEEARASLDEVPTDGPFAGVPFLIKDIGAHVVGVRQTQGVAMLADFVSDHDSELTSRYRRAGLVLVGKSNTSAFATSAVTEPVFTGVTRNPWNLEHTPGGSSGGAGAAIAAGLVPMAHGSDGGGSIRIPASCCGLFGLKPSRGRNSMGPDAGEGWGSLLAEHALTRSVRDSAALLDATAGPVPGDPYHAPPPARPFLAEVGADPGRLRIGVTTESPFGTAVHADCVAAAEDAAALCESLGHDVEGVSLPAAAEDVLGAMQMVIQTQTAMAIEDLASMGGHEVTAELLEPRVWGMYEATSGVRGVDYARAIHTLHRATREVTESLAAVDVLLTPTLGTPPPAIGIGEGNGTWTFIPFTPLFNATGQPAMSVPLMWNAEGLPVGSQFVGGYGDESMLFRLAGQLETARPWADRRPPLDSQAQD